MMQGQGHFDTRGQAYAVNPHVPEEAGLSKLCIVTEDHIRYIGGRPVRIARSRGVQTISIHFFGVKCFQSLRLTDRS